MGFHQAYAVAAATTFAVEAIVALAVVRHERLLVRTPRLLGVVLLANTLTHPPLWYVPYFLAPHLLAPENYALYVIVGEAAALVIESAAYWRLLARSRPWLALGMAALANSASYSAGLVLARLL